MLFFHHSTHGFLGPLAQLVEELCICPGRACPRPCVPSRVPRGHTIRAGGTPAIFTADWYPLGWTPSRPSWVTGSRRQLPQHLSSCVSGLRVSKAALPSATSVPRLETQGRRRLSVPRAGPMLWAETSPVATSHLLRAAGNRQGLPLCWSHAESTA